MYKRSFLLAFGALMTSACGSKASVYARSCSVPPEDFNTSKDGIGHLRIVQIIKLDREGRIYWGDKRVSEAELKDRLRQLDALMPPPQLILSPEPDAPCAEVTKLREMLLRASICRTEGRNCGEGSNPETWQVVGGP